MSGKSGSPDRTAGAVRGVGLGVEEPPGSRGWGVQPPLSRDETVRWSPGSTSPRDGWQDKAGCLFERSVNS